jgi:tripartite-type tricarboxylate transporter receptor subunit TctC
MRARLYFSVLAAAVMILSSPAPVAAQPYPSKPIRIVTPYVAGEAADITARVIAQKLSDSFGTSAIVDNRAGANGMLGTDAVAKSRPDGYTLLLVASGPVVVNPSLYPKVPYDAMKDLAPIVQATTYQWQGMFAPGGTDKSIIDKLNEATNRALQAPDVVDRLVNKGGNEIVGGTPNDFLNVIKADFTRYSKLIKEANITPE